MKTCIPILLAAGWSAGAAELVPLPLPTLTENLLTWTDGAAYAPLFPSSRQTLGGIPFEFQTDASGNNIFYGGTLASPVDAELHIPVNRFGVTSVYTLINSAYGTSGSIVGAVTLKGSAGDEFVVDLVEGVNVRDHYYGSFVNGITDPSVTLAVFGDPSPGHAHFDLQVLSLPGAFASQTLEEIVFFTTAPGGAPNPYGKAFLAAVTVAVPTGLPDAGSTLGLLALAAGMLVSLRPRVTG